MYYLYFSQSGLWIIQEEEEKLYSKCILNVYGKETVGGFKDMLANISDLKTKGTLIKLSDLGKQVYGLS